MTIYAIDDEKLSLQTLERMINDAIFGVQVYTFTRARAALESIEKGIKPQLVFCDIEMPGLSGLEFAVELKKVCPETRLIFVTAYSEYAVDAYTLNAGGYLLKPVTAEAIRKELASEPMLDESKNNMGKLEVHCFGDFSVSFGGQPLKFKKKDTKELFALLVDREGDAVTSEDIIYALWKGELSGLAAKQRIRGLIGDLKNTLSSIGMEDVLIHSRKQISINRNLINCDYYKMLAGDMNAVNSYRGEYMVGYTWAELTAAKLFFKVE